MDPERWGMASSIGWNEGMIGRISRYLAHYYALLALAVGVVCGVVFSKVVADIWSKGRKQMDEELQRVLEGETLPTDIEDFWH